jgi:hypothetical protein
MISLPVDEIRPNSGTTSAAFFAEVVCDEPRMQCDIPE